MSGARTSFISLISEKNYTAFLRSIYSTYATSNDKVREKIRASIKDRLGDFYYPNNSPDKAHTLFVFDFDIKSNKIIIQHSAKDYGQGTGALEFSANKAIITNRPYPGSEASEIVVNDSENSAQTPELNRFLSRCNLHTIPELVDGFLGISSEQTIPSTGKTEVIPALTPTDEVQYPPLSPQRISTNAHLSGILTHYSNQQPPQQYQPFPQYEPHLPVPQPSQDRVDEKTYPEVYTSQRYDNNAQKYSLSTQVERLHRSHTEIEANKYFNTGNRKKTAVYKRYANIDCIDLSEAKKKPNLFYRYFYYTKVQINQGELGLITHNNQEEILAPGIYYFSKSTRLNKEKGKDGKVRASDPLIEHGKIKIVTVPSGHLEHAFVTDEKRTSRVLMEPGRYNFDRNTDKVAKVINPYGLETSLENDETPFLVTVPEGKVGIGEVKNLENLLGSNVQTYLPGRTLVDTEQEKFEGRVSTKIQTVTFKKMEITLENGVTATVDVTTRYQIPDESKLSLKPKSSLQKVVETFGRTEKDIKEKIENPTTGLAQQTVRDVCKGIKTDQILQGNKIIIADLEDDLNVPENKEYKGVKFLSVSFNNITFNSTHANKLATTAITSIEQHLTELDNKESKAYLKMRKEILCDLGVTSHLEIKMGSNQRSASPQHVAKLDIDQLNGEATRNKQQMHKLPSQIRTLSPEESANYFERIERPVNANGNYVYHTPDGETPIHIPCVSESYLNSLMGWFDWLPNWVTGNKSIVIEADQIGLIRINGKPEFLKPGEYNLPSSVEWVRSERIKSDKGEKVIIQHDSITIANIPEGDALYVEDNTKVIEYSFLGKGIHVIDSPTMTYRELVPYENALIVKRSEDENNRINARKWEFYLDLPPAPPAVPDKRKIYLRAQNGYIAYTVQNSRGLRADGTLMVSAPRPFTKEALSKLEIQILQELANNKQIKYNPEQDKSNKLLSVRIGPTEAGIFYDETGALCICGPGEFELNDKYTFYTKIPLQGTKEISVETYTADNIRVKVQAMVDYQLPIKKLEDAIRAGGVNKIENEIERLATEAVNKQVRLLNFISAAKITYTDTQEFQTYFSDLTKEATQETLRTSLRNLIDSGIAITNVRLTDQITPTDPNVRMALLKILSKKAEIRETIKDELGAQAGLMQTQVQQQRPQQVQRPSNDTVSAANLQHQGMHANRQYQALVSASQAQANSSTYQPYSP